MRPVEHLAIELHNAGIRVVIESLDDLEKNHILMMLSKYRWNISAAAKALGIDRVTLYNKIKKYNLKPAQR